MRGHRTHFLLDTKKIVITDLDVHQGNGTAEIFSKQSMFYFFLRMAKPIHPFKKRNF
jgi:acetoin utilization deacetylase AcuC-like enzyme